MQQHQQPSRLSVIQRRPKRISITLPFHVWSGLVERSDYEGRSVSNLAAYVIEQGLVATEDRRSSRAL